jgi:hypothetical protein
MSEGETASNNQLRLRAFPEDLMMVLLCRDLKYESLQRSIKTPGGFISESSEAFFSRFSPEGLGYGAYRVLDIGSY